MMAIAAAMALDMALAMTMAVTLTATLPVSARSLISRLGVPGAIAHAAPCHRAHFHRALSVSFCHTITSLPCVVIFLLLAYAHNKITTVIVICQ